MVSKCCRRPFTLNERRREVRSFVLRQGHFTPAQKRAFDHYWPRFGVDFIGQLRDLDVLFWTQCSEGAGGWFR